MYRVIKTGFVCVLYNSTIYYKILCTMRKYLWHWCVLYFFLSLQNVYQSVYFNCPGNNEIENTTTLSIENGTVADTSSPAVYNYNILCVTSWLLHIKKLKCKMVFIPLLCTNVRYANVSSKYFWLKQKLRCCLHVLYYV